MVGVHPDAKAHPQHAFFTRSEGGQNAGCGFLQVFLNGAVQGQHGILVFDEIAKLAVFFVPNRGFQGNRFLGDFHDLAHFLEGHL